MRAFQLLIIFWIITVPVVFAQDEPNTCVNVFTFKSDSLSVANDIQICSNAEHVLVGYEAFVDLPVCDDKLCSNLKLKLYWDLAGNYIRFDTLPGIPLTKFDKIQFSDNDYKKLDQILKIKNSVLRLLEKGDLIDQNIKLRATTVDATTGATPATIKNAVVDGAVYSTYTLWHFVNGELKDSIRSCTNKIYSWLIAMQLLKSNNYDTQLFALKKLSTEDYESHFTELTKVILESAPVIRAYLISKAPLPFEDSKKNQDFVSLFPKLDTYSKSVFFNRITGEESFVPVMLPLMESKINEMSDKQRDLFLSVWQKFNIPGYYKLLKNELMYWRPVEKRVK